MLNDTEEKRKNELLDKMDKKEILTNAEYIEIRSLTQKAISHMVFSNVGAA